jgi:hypothetical protein
MASKIATTIIMVAITIRFFVKVPSICFLKDNPTMTTGMVPIMISQPSQASCDRRACSFSRLEMIAASVFQEHVVVAYKCPGDIPDVTGKIDQHAIRVPN